MPLFVSIVPFPLLPHALPALRRAAVTAPAGWQDEMGQPDQWSSISASNPVVVSRGASGTALSLPHVPSGFPFAYQWSGVTRKAVIDLGRFPVLMACVSRMRSGSYAHVEIYERAYDGALFRSARGSLLRGPGITSLDLGDTWGRDSRRVEIRLIVGGPLEGAGCEYAWVRAVSHAAAKAMPTTADARVSRADHAPAHSTDRASFVPSAPGAHSPPGAASHKPQAKPRRR